MLVADFGIVVLWIAVALVIGFIGFFVAVLVMVVRAIQFVLRAAWGRTRNPGATAPPAEVRAARCCLHPRCGYLSPGDARYCARCGRPLSQDAGVDSYG